MIPSVLGGGDILLIVPPFTTNSSVIGPHILQAVARQNGFNADILYLNILLAAIIGFDLSEKIGTSELFQYWGMLNERLFARSAHGLPPLGFSPEFCADEAMSTSGNRERHRKMDYDEAEPVHLDTFLEMEKTCKSFVDETVRAIAALPYKIVGCTARMGQTNCSVALFKGLKQIRREIITILGGANCQGEMAEGIASLSPAIDFIFSGESEISFQNFLINHRSGQLPQKRIVEGSPMEDLDTLPQMDYESYFRQLRAFLGDDAPSGTYVWSETSRGCWWGQKNKCTFCSRNNESLKFRAKSPQKVLDELDSLKKRYPGVPVGMADNIMPHTYYRELLPILAEKKDYPEICLYYMKANLKLEDLVNLSNARVTKIVPGIEALSTGLLKLLNKGVTAAENISLLRNARSVGLNLLWFMLWGAPGDKIQFYEEVLNLMPLIRHLQPPHKFFRVNLERFSHYCENPGSYRIENLRPWNVYNMIFPQDADIDKIAFGFAGDYPSEAYENPGVIRELVDKLEHWRETWQKAGLVMVPLDDYFIIQDKRGLPGASLSHVIPLPRAREIMTDAPYRESQHQQWAVEQKLGVVVDSRFVPLVTASPELLFRFKD